MLGVGHVSGTRGSGIVSITADVLWMSVVRGMRVVRGMSVVRGMRGVGGVCVWLGAAWVERG